VESAASVDIAQSMSNSFQWQVVKWVCSTILIYVCLGLLLFQMWRFWKDDCPGSERITASRPSSETLPRGFGSAHERPSVLVVTPYPPDRGRLSEYAFELTKGLASKGLKTKVASDAEPSFLGAGFPTAKRLWTLDNPLSLLILPFRIISARPRLVLYNAHMAVFGRNKTVNFEGFIGMRVVSFLGPVFGYKTVVILHSLPEAVNIESFGLKPGLLNALGLLIAEKCALSCDAVVVTIRLYQRLVFKRFGRQPCFIPHGAWEIGQEEVPQRDGRNSLLFLGYMLPSKDMTMLAAAYSTVRKKNAWIKLKVATSPHPSFPHAVDQLAVLRGLEGVEYLGHLSDDELQSVFKATVALLLPYSTATGTSGVLHLVSSCGLPVVATDLIEFRQSQAEGAGLVLVKDAAGMAQAAMRLIEDKEYWKELSERSRAFAKSRSWDVISSEFLKLFEERSS
jgi:glycosyltransferase involved in cell wall biosynthesis